MRRFAVLYLAPALLFVGCGRQQSAPQAYNQPQQAAQNQFEQEGNPPAPPPGGDNQAVNAPSPFGSRNVGSPQPPEQPEDMEANRPPAPGGSPASQPEAVTIPAGTRLRVRLADTIDTRRNRAGDRFTATLDAPVLGGDRVLIPRGTNFAGHVTSARSSGRLRGRAELGLTLDSFRLNGATYRISTSGVIRASANHNKRNLGFIGGGSGVGAVLGAIAGGGKGALIGAGAGAAAGTAGAAITGKRNVRLPVETRLAFSLTRPIEL